MRVIDSFRGEHFFLSNFYPVGIRFRGNIFPSAEHAFMSAKTADERRIEAIRTAATPADAQRIGRSVPLVPDWDRIRFDVMAEVITAKFDSAELTKRLLASGGALLIEGNSWHDQTWGSCNCDRHWEIDGDNALGVLLMAERLRRKVAG